MKYSLDEIACKYCEAVGQRKDVHKDGWILAKNHPFAYVCPECVPKDNQRRKKHE